MPGGARADTIRTVRALRVLQQRREAASARVQAEVGALLAGAGPAAAAERAHEVMDEAGRRALARTPAPAPACSAGCSYCCHVHVEATVPEILAVARHVERTWTAVAQAALRDRLARHVRRVEPLDDQQRWQARIPCALLGDDGRCTIYEARPLVCRSFSARAVDPCREAFEGRADRTPEPIPALARAHDAVEAGYERALVEAGLSAAGQRLESGLLAALEDPGADRPCILGR